MNQLDSAQLGQLLPEPPEGDTFDDWVDAIRAQHPERTGLVGWHLESLWGADGYSLGNHPYTAVALCDPPGAADGLFGVLTWTEGDLGGPDGFLTREERDAYVDQTALWGWHHNGGGPRDDQLPPEDRPDLLPASMRGRYQGTGF